jgi:hypothetical protein
MASEYRLPVLTESKGKIQVVALVSRTLLAVSIAALFDGVTEFFQPVDRFVNR